jgi:hypothetical protein
MYKRHPRFPLLTPQNASLYNESYLFPLIWGADQENRETFHVHDLEL